ncbi:hypothetical protein QQ045_031728 [Rhodiola kirilowii]
MNFTRLVYSVSLMTLRILSQNHLNSADESVLPSLRKDLTHPLKVEHSSNHATSVGSLQKLRINIKRRGGGGRGRGRFVRGRSGGSSAASSIIPNTVKVFSVLGFFVFLSFFLI